MDVIPESCDRFRASISLGLDDMLSRFETRLLERHLDACPDCQAFAADVTEQTARLRAAPLVQAPPLAEIGRAPSHRGRRVVAFATAGAAAVIAALVTLAPPADNRHAVSEHPVSNNVLLAVVAKQPTANATIVVPRVQVVSPASADGPVRGYYGVPA